MGIQGKRALIIGGSGGIGREVSRILHAAGARLLIHGQSPQKLANLVQELGPGLQGFQPTSLAYSLRADTWKDFIAEIAAYPAPDILVTAFGPFLQKSLADTRVDDWEELCALNLALPGALVSSVLPSMLGKSYGRILLFGGTQTDGLRGFTSNAAYAAAKTGLGSLAKSVAKAGRGLDLRCICVCPGFVDTEYLSPSLREELRRKSPGGHLIQAQALAQEALDILFTGDAQTNGSSLCLDGGLILA